MFLAVWCSRASILSVKVFHWSALNTFLLRNNQTKTVWAVFHPVGRLCISVFPSSCRLMTLLQFIIHTHTHSISTHTRLQILVISISTTSTLIKGPEFTDWAERLDELQLAAVVEAADWIKQNKQTAAVCCWHLTCDSLRDCGKLSLLNIQ